MADQNHTSSHGIFINYKRSQKHLAWVVFEYFKNKGIDPFIDTVTLQPDGDYQENMRQEIGKAPYFFCILTEDGLEDLLAPKSENNIYRMEVEEAVRLKKIIFVLRDSNVSYDEMYRLEEPLRTILPRVNSQVIPEYLNGLLFTLDYFWNYISMDKLDGVINWREYAAWNTNACFLSRQEMERTTASFEHRFGREFMACVKNREEYTGEYKVKEINMACYAANIIFTPKQEMLDRKAYDLGLMFNTFSALLKDPDFNLRIIINAPDSPAAKDAVKYRRLGNSSFEDNYEGVFLSSFAHIHQLMKEDIYKSAAKRHRFSMLVTECALPFAIFHVVYKNGWEEFNHVKIDLYSMNLDSSVDRRSIMVFEQNDKANYDYFVNQFMYLYKTDSLRQRSKQLIQKNTDKWLKEWDELRSPEEEE